MMMMTMAFVSKYVTRMMVLRDSLSLSRSLRVMLLGLFWFSWLCVFELCTASADWEDNVSVGANSAGRMMRMCEVRLGGKSVWGVNPSSYVGLNLGEFSSIALRSEILIEGKEGSRNWNASRIGWVCPPLLLVVVACAHWDHVLVMMISMEIPT